MTPRPPSAGAPDGAPGTRNDHLPTGAAQLLRLPSATTTRFLILVVATAGVALYFLPQPLLVAVLVAGDLGVLPDVARTLCPEEALAQVGDVPARELRQEYLDCAALTSAIDTGTLVVALVFPLLIGLLIYTLYPRWLRRRLRPLAHPKAGHTAYMERELAWALGSRQGQVRLLITPGTAGGARVFGAWGRYWIAVDRSLLPATDADLMRPSGPPDRSDALIHHEAAHVLNRDIDITYLAIAIWWGLVLCVVPATVLMLPTPLADPARVVSLALVLMVLSHARSRVLQAREYYADVRAARSPGIAEPLLRLLPTPRSERRIIRWWRALSSAHPPPDWRAETIRDPSRLQDTGVLDIFYAGSAVGVAFSGFQHLVRATSGWADRSYYWFIENASGVLFGILLGFVVCTFVWRAALRALMRAERRMRVVTAALALTTGVLVGQVVGPGRLETTWIYLLELRPVAALLVAAVLWVVFAVILRWILMVATTWLSVSESVWPLWLCAAVTALMFVLTLTQWFFAVGRMTLDGSGQTAPFSELQLLILPVIDPAWIAASCFGSALPLLAWLVWSRELPGRDAAPRLCPPWLPVGFSAVVLLGLVIAVAWALRWLADRTLGGTAETDSVSAMLSTLQPVLILGLGTILVCTVAFAWVLGGTGARGRVLSATVVILFISSFLAIPALYMGLAAGVCVRTIGDPGHCGAAFAEFGAEVSVVGESGPIVFASLALVCVPVALAVSSLRAVVGPRPWLVRPNPRRWHDVLALAVLAALGSVVLVDSASSFATEPSMDPAEPYTSAVPEDSPGEGALDGRRTCEAVDAEFSLVIDFQDHPAASAVSTVYVLARSTDPILSAFADPALADLGEEVMLEGVASAERSRTAAQHYCALRYPGTGLLR